jgi:hypothetical protein
MINLVHREKLMIAELKKSVSFATGLKSQVEHVLVKRLRLREIVNFDSNMVAAIDLNIHPPIITLILRASSVGRMGAFPVLICLRKPREGDFNGACEFGLDIGIKSGGCLGHCGYKDIHTIMAAQTDLVDVLGRFDPKLVKMCAAGERAED